MMGVQLCGVVSMGGNRSTHSAFERERFEEKHNTSRHAEPQLKQLTPQIKFAKVSSQQSRTTFPTGALDAVHRTMPCSFILKFHFGYFRHCMRQVHQVRSPCRPVSPVLCFSCSCLHFAACTRSRALATPPAIELHWPS